MFRIPDIGRVRFQAKLFRPTQLFSTTGQASYSFTEMDTVKCHAKNVRGTYNDDGVQEVAGKRTYQFIIRKYSVYDETDEVTYTFDYGWEIEYNGVRFRPDRIDPWDERDRFFIIYAVEVDL